MDAAKSTIKKFMSNDGKHDTTVHQRTNAAVQNETIAREEHERQTTAVDREVHQDHYHTTEQPVSHSEVLPEQHHHKAAAVEHRSFEHGNADQVKDRLDQENQKYYNTQDRVEGQRTHSDEGTIQGEHVHHHVHETIQPVVQKQTVEPHVVHSTVPIHEVHHNEAHHHASTALAPVSMDEFKNQGGSLTGHDWQQTRHEAGEPQSIGGHRVHDDHGPVAGTTDHSGMDDRTKRATTERIGTDARTNPGVGGDNYGSSNDRFDNDGRNYQNTGRDYENTGRDGRYGTDGQIGSSNNNDNFGTMDTQKKPSLMDKINPKVDATGDGKAGFMK